MRPRAFILLVVLGVLAVLSAVGTVVFARTAESIAKAASDDRRDQLLWLARSAATHPERGSQTIRTPRGVVQIEVVAGRSTTRVRATGFGAQATIDASASTWIERIDTAPSEQP